MKVMWKNLMIQNYKKYVYIKDLKLNLKSITNSCNIMRKIVNENFQSNSGGFMGELETTKEFSKYNCFMYPLDQFYELYKEIQIMYNEVRENDDVSYIQCWLNVYKKGQFIDWHGHWDENFNAWHGFYCVDVEPNSFTEYRFVNEDWEFLIPSKNNLLVMGKSKNDEHRSSPWEHDNPRITIAYDILPKKHVPIKDINHWIPI